MPLPLCYCLWVTALPCPETQEVELYGLYIDSHLNGRRGRVLPTTGKGAAAIAPAAGKVAVRLAPLQGSKGSSTYGVNKAHIRSPYAHQPAASAAAAAGICGQPTTATKTTAKEPQQKHQKQQQPKPGKSSASEAPPAAASAAASSDVERNVYSQMLDEEFDSWQHGVWILPQTLEKAGMHKDNIYCLKCKRDSTEVPKLVAFPRTDDRDVVAEPYLLCGECLPHYAHYTDMTLTPEGVAEWAKENVLGRVDAVAMVYAVHPGITHNKTQDDLFNILLEGWVKTPATEAQPAGDAAIDAGMQRLKQVKSHTAHLHMLDRRLKSYKQDTWLPPLPLESAGMDKTNMHCSRCATTFNDYVTGFIVIKKAPMVDGDSSTGPKDQLLMCADCSADYARETHMALTDEGVAEWAKEHLVGLTDR